MTYKLFLDTNILLDQMIDDRPGSDDALRLTGMATRGNVLCTISTTSLSDVYYISRRTVPERKRRAWLEFFLDAFEAVAPDTNTCRTALASDEPDYEDGVVRALAERCHADYIISRDERAFAGSGVPRLSAAEFLEVAGLGGTHVTR
ncbi:type II toxin-antitoxin system VapC family toxin [Thermophilibacter sp.]